MAATDSPQHSTEFRLPRQPTERAVNLPLTIIEPSHRWLSLKLHELWEYRELLYSLVSREVKLKYKQTAIGIVWAVLQPLMTMLVFTVIFATFANMPSDGLPYPVFVFSALLPWNYFAKALNNSVLSIVGNAHMINKVYFPRLLLLLAATLSGLVEFGISFTFLLAMMIWYGIVPLWSIVITLPLFLLLTMLTALSVSLWLSVINVRYRDVAHILPFLTQMWFFASPVAYPLSVVPKEWRVIYDLNPMTGVIEGFRWVLLGKQGPSMGLLILSTVLVVGLLLGGMIFFKRMERTFADVV